MGRRLFLHLVVACVAFLPFGLPVAAAPGTHVSGPVVHDNLAVYFVHVFAAQNAVPMSLEEALAKGRLKVNETGSVNELTVENVGDDEVFVQAGEIVKGGRQDRVLSMDLLLPPGSGRVSIAAFCVESGRWSARGQEDPRQFSTAAAAMPSHEAKLAMRNYIAAAPVTVTSPFGRAKLRRACGRRSAPSRCRRTSGGNLGKRARDTGATFALGRCASGRPRLAVEFAALAREREAQGGAGRLYRRAARRRQIERQYRRLCFRHQR